MKIRHSRQSGTSDGTLRKYMQKMEAKLSAKLQLLEVTRGKTKDVAVSDNLEKIRRHKEALQTIVAGFEELKRDIEQGKLEKGETVDEVKEWGEETEGKIDIVDNDIKFLEARLKEIITHSENEECETKEYHLAREREEQLKFERHQLEQKAEFSKAQNSTTDLPHKHSVKLPKLVITKYNGALENWLSLWNKFEAEIYSTDLPAVTKFANLKELVEPRVRKGIDGLPFTTEGYEHAKSILKSNYGKMTRIMNAYISYFTVMPVKCS